MGVRRDWEERAGGEELLQTKLGKVWVRGGARSFTTQRPSKQTPVGDMEVARRAKSDYH